MPLLSIIIPVYNAEKYLRSTLDSVFCQDYARECEVLLVNDGSTDSSLAIMQEYADRYENINIVEKANEGVSAARNCGIKRAGGSYLFFMDADDVLSPYFFSTILPQLRDESLDILAWKYATFYRRPTFVPLGEVRSQTVQNDKTKNSAFNFLMQAGIATSPCTKVFRREILNGIRFDGRMTFGEDMFFCWEAILSANRIEFLNRPLYYYRQSGRGAVAHYHAGLYENYRASFEAMLEFIRENGLACQSLEKDVRYHFACRLQSLTLMETRAPYSRKMQETRLLNIINDSLIRQALDEDSRLTAPIYEWARKRDARRMLRHTRIDSLKSRILFPIKKILK